MSRLSEARQAEGRTVENVNAGVGGSLVITFTDGTGLRIWSGHDRAVWYMITFLIGLLVGIVVVP